MNWSRSWSKFRDSDRIVPSPSRSASRPWCWVGRSVMFLFDCWLAVGSIISNPGCWTVNHGGSSRPNPNPKRKRRDKYSELGCGMDWTYGEEQDFVGKGLHQSIWGKEYREGFEKLECYSRATVRDDPAIIQLKTIVEALRRTLKKPWWTDHVALPDHGVGLDGQSCSCLIVGWPVGLSSPTLGVDRPGGSSRPNPNPKRKRRDRFRELGCGMDWTDGGETRLHWERTSSRVGKTKIEKMVGVIRNEHGQVRIMGNQSVMAEQQYEMIQRSFN
ncbi:hypothetical protein DY000_02038394 [Brassica cretica]|uniref:Uncharacterized protein n=1 Tax=Brassica cretica TaxID=69181 RepID=A0ABQ7BBR3_BRACR|nr:hypothetical protein DY000_02038394 [Brassica cretica]